MTNFDPYSSLKSKGERQIAEFLERRQIEYQYEYPLAIVDRGRTKIWYPDFRLPEYDTIIEYFGMNGDPAYDEQMMHKIKAYHQAGIHGIYLLESTMRGNWKEMIIEKIEQNLEAKLRKIQGHRMEMNRRRTA